MHSVSLWSVPEHEVEEQAVITPCSWPKLLASPHNFQCTWVRYLPKVPKTPTTCLWRTVSGIDRANLAPRWRSTVRTFSVGFYSDEQTYARFCHHQPSVSTRLRFAACRRVMQYLSQLLSRIMSGVAADEVVMRPTLALPLTDECHHYSSVSEVPWDLQK